MYVHRRHRAPVARAAPQLGQLASRQLRTAAGCDQRAPPDRRHSVRDPRQPTAEPAPAAHRQRHDPSPRRRAAARAQWRRWRRRWRLPRRPTPSRPPSGSATASALPAGRRPARAVDEQRSQRAAAAATPPPPHAAPRWPPRRPPRTPPSRLDDVEFFAEHVAEHGGGDRAPGESTTTRPAQSG